MADDCCSGTLELDRLADRQRRVLRVVFAVNLLTFAGMVGAAFVAGSSSLMSGALDNLGDALTYALSLAAVSAGTAAKARVALFKGVLIFGAALGVAVQIAYRLHLGEVPVVGIMLPAALINLAANALCLWLLHPHRHSDVNMSSVYECSRNDVAEGGAVIVAAGGVWYFDALWPDVLVAALLLLMFLRSAWRVVAGATAELRHPATAG